MSRALKRVSLIASPLLLAGFLATNLIASAIATGQPADKVAAAGSTVEEVTHPTTVLREQMRVSTPSDLILQLTAECSILTRLTTGGMTDAGVSDTAMAEGAVEMRIMLDGTPVPVASNDSTDPDETGWITFCNREHERKVTDHEEDGLDELEDYMRTKAANAFNWFALNTGSTYDDLSNGQNILDIVVEARYKTESATGDFADAYVGSRTLIVEPTKAAVNEKVTDDSTEGPKGKANGNGG